MTMKRQIGWVLALGLATGMAGAAPDAAGRWEGVAEIPGAPLALVVDLAPDAQRGWIGSVILPGRGIAGARLGAVAAGDDGVRFTLGAAFTIPEDPPPSVQLRWQADGTLAGSFRQGGHEAPLKLVRSGAPQVERPVATPLAAALAGLWRGRYELGGYPRDVTLTLARRPDGSGGGELLVVGKRTTKLPLEQVVQGSRFITIEAGGGIRIEGRWQGGEIDGRFVQGPFEAPLKLKREGGA